MPTPTIPAGNLFMNATTYTGTGASQTITNGVSGQSFAPDFVWAKSRSNAYGNGLFDIVRGVTKSLQSQDTAAEETRVNDVTAFNTNGFTAGGGTNTNGNGATYVAWQWKAGGTAVTNTAGTISSQVSANTTSGFSIVTYTGTGANATVGHGLGVTPAMYIVKIRSGANNWTVWHKNLANTTTSYILLDSTAAQTTSANVWGSTAATSTTIGVGTAGVTNASGSTYVAYCWSEIAGYSAFGSYTGNGSADGPFVYTGFRPRWLLAKRTDSGGDWNIVDTSRNTSNVANLELFPNDARSETTGGGLVADLNSNGFKIRTSDTFYNASGGTYIYAAFAENPFKYANAR
jgi:hypothetical protein